MLTTACSGAGELDDESDAPTGVLTIDSHDDGDVVDSDSVQLRGTAPATAEVVHNVNFGRDKRTTADENGEWVMTIDLDEGDNDITLRIGDDDATSKTIRIVYDPETAAATSEPTAEPDDGETPKPTPVPATPKPTPTPAPRPDVATFGSGDLIVGADVEPGTYRTRETADFCYWERVSGFGGSLDDIIANGTGGGYFVVTIDAGDAGFSSQSCGTWSADLSAVTSDPAGPITEDGVYIVGTDIAPGTWRSSGGNEFGCYAARLSGFGGTIDHVIANDLSTDGGRIISIAASDRGFETTGCGTWEKVG